MWCSFSTMYWQNDNDEKNFIIITLIDENVNVHKDFCAFI